MGSLAILTTGKQIKIWLQQLHCQLPSGRELVEMMMSIN